MSNHAYESAAALRPHHCEPTSMRILAEEFGFSAYDANAQTQTIAVNGVSVDSSDVAPGELFVALPGMRYHGANFAAQALANGAVAVLTDAQGAEIVRAASSQAPIFVHQQPRALVGPLAARVYHHPAQHLITTAVTGTNGKTTTAYFVAAILAAHCGDCMVAGTVELRVGATRVESPRTTVEAPVLQRMLALAVEENIGAASLEASSHAIVLHRLDGMIMDVVGFTNLQRDHLDFHKTMPAYLEAKAQLFTAEHARRAVVCVDDQWGVQLAEQLADGIVVERLRAYQREADSDSAGGADWWVSDAKVSMSEAATTFTLHGPRGQAIKAQCPLPGLVNVQNAALALAMTLSVGVDPQTAVQALARAHNIPGRMQRIIQRDGTCGTCIVDFAHTPEALELALQAVRQITPGRLIVVFGSDGDRDQGKRPLLGEAAARLADVLVVTDENPRSEDPQSIRDAILQGVRRIRPDLKDVEEIKTWRADAVRRGVQLCGPQDTVIVTGKGHEPFLEIAGNYIRYNDVPIMQEAVAQKWPQSIAAATGSAACTQKAAQ